jgi:predicted small metal-binding protein
MKRALDCFCGEYLEGDNDEELLNWARAHVQRQHSDMELTDEQVQGIVQEGAYDTQGKAQQGKTQ